MTKQREHCVNLTADEARAFAAGATVLIRPAKAPTSRSGIVHLRDGVMYGTWSVGDVLILREKWVWASPAKTKLLFLADEDITTTKWFPATWMHRTNARHRYPVLSVRVCQLHAVTAREKADAGWRPAGWVRARPDGNLDGEAWVSVTTVNRAPAPGEGSKT